MRRVSCFTSALLLIALVAAPAAVRAQIRTASLPDIEPLDSDPITVSLTAGGTAQTITLSASYVGQLTNVRFLLNGAATANLTAQWGAAADTDRPLTIQASAAAAAGTYTVQAQNGTRWMIIPTTVTVVAPTTATAVKPTDTSSTTASPARGRYRVVLTGGRVNHETVDNFLQLDGKYDEVYLTVDVQLLDKATGAIAPFMTLSDRTVTYGDITGFPERVLAGTAGALGGLKTLDQFPAEGPFKGSTALADRRLPLRLWEGELIQGQTAVIITPLVWEHDGTAFAQAATAWLNFTKDFTTKLAESKSIDQLVGATVGPGFNMVIDVLPLASTLVLGVVSQLGSDGDRPIGATIEGDKVVFKPQSILLNYDRIEQFLNSGVQVGNAPRGFYPITFREPMSNKLEGDYTVYLKFERVP